MRALAVARSNLTATTFYAEPRAEDLHGLDYDETGFITPDWLRRHTPLDQADYYLCGPRPFLRARKRISISANSCCCVPA